MSLKHIQGVLFSILLFFVPLQIAAEIELVVIRWGNVLCQDSCIRTVTNQIRRLNGAAELIVSQPDAQVSIRWKPFTPFTVDSIRSVMSASGLRFEDIRVHVRGTIVRSGRAFVLRSIGDNTSFILIGPAQASMTITVANNNLDAHILSPELQQQFADAERDSVVTVVDGPLFTRMRQAGIYLIVERATFNRLGPGAIPGR